MKKNFWQAKRVFITGHTGFKGSWLALWLRKLGASVSGYALPPDTKPSLFELARVDSSLESSIFGDVRNFDELAAALRQAQPEIVIHMAAQPLVRYSYISPIETYATNVMGTVHLCEAVRQTPSVRAVVVVTSDKCYENQEWVWGYRENEPMGGYDPYSNSKGCAELVVSAYRKSFFNRQTGASPHVGLATARAGNVIGGGDWAQDRLIPDIMRAIENGAEVVIRSPNAIRPWQHVLEPLSGYLMLAERLYENGAAFGEGWNFGPSDSDVREVEWISSYLTGKWGGGARYRIDESAAIFHEAHYLKLDISKARAKLGWQPRWSLDQALDSILDWHKAYIDHQDMQAVTLQQIEFFEKRLDNSVAYR